MFSDQHSLFIPERPGNKVAISAGNIIKNEKIELLMLIPGTDTVMSIHGKASLTRNDKLLDLAIVNNKRPKLGILLTKCHFLIKQSKAIQQSQPWLNENHIDPTQLTRFSRALSAHMAHWVSAIINNFIIVIFITI